MRQCGECQLCCKLLPVRELAKGAGERCRHQRFRKGCLIYHQPSKGFPPSCGLWNCAWLQGDAGTEILSRPDRSHLVIDLMPDFVTLVQNDTGERIVLPVIQVWIDPAFPDAHRDPAFRAYLEARAEKEGCAALIRYDATEAFLLAPPVISTDHQWHEQRTGAMREETHSFAEVVEAIGVR